MAKKVTQWEYCEIYKIPTNLTYENAYVKRVGAEYFSVIKFSRGGLFFGGEEMDKSRPWLPDATAVKNVPKDELGIPNIIYCDAKTVLRNLIAELGLDGWELIYLNDSDEFNKPLSLLKRRIE